MMKKEVTAVNKTREKSMHGEQQGKHEIMRKVNARSILFNTRRIFHLKSPFRGVELYPKENGGYIF